LRAKLSFLEQRDEESWIASSLLLAMMTFKRTFAISRHVSPEACWKFSLPSDQRTQGKPGARCTRGIVWE